MMNNARKYTEEIINWFMNNYKNKGLVELANEMNEKFNLDMTNKKVSNLKSKLKREGIKFEKVPNSGCFKKGGTSFNKNKKWSDYMSEEGKQKSLKTTFKKGNMPHNYRPVGSERVNVDGFIEIKIADPNKWELKQRYIYKQKYGEIPKGYTIIFLDGNKQNLDINNLKAISRHENLIMNKNNLRYNNKELTETACILAQIEKKRRQIKNERF